jgi:hypothetical protein
MPCRETHQPSSRCRHSVARQVRPDRPRGLGARGKLIIALGTRAGGEHDCIGDCPIEGQSPFSETLHASQRSRLLKDNGATVTRTARSLQ